MFLAKSGFVSLTFRMPATQPLYLKTLLVFEIPFPLVPLVSLTDVHPFLLRLFYVVQYLQVFVLSPFLLQPAFEFDLG